MIPPYLLLSPFSVYSSVTRQTQGNQAHTCVSRHIGTTVMHVK